MRSARSYPQTLLFLLAYLLYNDGIQTMIRMASIYGAEVGKAFGQFGLGYATEAWDDLLVAAENEHVSADTLEKAGLVIPRKDGSGHYDRYRGRVIFPIFSHIGKTIGFGGRILDAQSDQPKYINSPETPVYQKSRVLYGLHQGRQDIRRQEEALLVEGYTDVISLHQAGVENAVATCGTALTPEQVRLLSRYARRIVLLYDADGAGLNAAARGIDTVLEHWRMDETDVQKALAEGFAVYAVMLPEGDDPDTYVRRHGADAFREYVRKHRQDFVAFRYELAKRAGELNTPEGTVAAQQAALTSIAYLPNPLLREQYLRRAAEVFGDRTYQDDGSLAPRSLPGAGVACSNPPWARSPLCTPWSRTV